MHRSPGFNPPEKESTRTSTVDCAAAAGRFKEEHRRENKNRDIYIYIHTSPSLLQSFLQVFFKETVHPVRYPCARGYLERKDSSGYYIYIYICWDKKGESLKG